MIVYIKFVSNLNQNLDWLIDKYHYSCCRSVASSKPYNMCHFFIRQMGYLFSRALGSSHHGDVIMGTIASQITSLTIVYSTVYSDADQRKHQSSASLAFVQGIHRGPVNSPYKGPVTRKMFSFDDVIMIRTSRFDQRSSSLLAASL